MTAYAEFLNTGDNRLFERIGGLAGILFGGLVLYLILLFFLKRWARKKEHFVAQLLQKNIYYPGLGLILSLTVVAGWFLLGEYIPGKLFGTVAHILYIVIIVSVGILLLGIINFTKEIIFRRSEAQHYKDFTLRKVKTKYQLLQRMLNIFVIFGIVAVSLMTFDQVREVGNTLLASAGIVGLILGFAAQKSLGTIFAGIQIAISQPIRIDDTVVVEDTSGTIGEITLTYAVVHTWDGRRLIVPINYFLEQPFENWTRVSPEVVGKVKLYLDYSTPVEPLRREFMRWLEESPKWDRRKGGLLVTGSSESTMEIRMTMSARNSDDSWDLECMIRERMIAHIHENYPGALPRTRFEWEKTENGREQNDGSQG